MRYKPLSSDFYKKNRKNFMSMIKGESLAVFNSNDIYPVSADTELPFEQHRDIFYLSGIDQEETILILFPNAKEKKALQDLVKRLKNCKDQIDPEAIQTIVYSVGKDNGYQENLREWFKAIYEIIFGEQDGPRMGFFISFFGIKESIELINKYIK